MVSQQNLARSATSYLQRNTNSIIHCLHSQNFSLPLTWCKTYPSHYSLPLQYLQYFQYAIASIDHRNMWPLKALIIVVFWYLRPTVIKFEKFVRPAWFNTRCYNHLNQSEFRTRVFWRRIKLCHKTIVRSINFFFCESKRQEPSYSIPCFTYQVLQ